MSWVNVLHCRMVACIVPFNTFLKALITSSRSSTRNLTHRKMDSLESQENLD